MRAGGAFSLPPPSTGLQSHLFPLRWHSISLTLALCALTAWNQTENAVLCQGLHIPPPWNNGAVALINVTWAEVCAGELCPPLPCVRTVALWSCSCRPPLLRWEATIYPSFIHLPCLFAFSGLIFSSFPDFLNHELFSLRKWLNEGTVEIFPYSRNLFTAVEISNFFFCVCVFQKLY